MKSCSQQSWRSRLCTADIPLHSTLCPNVNNTDKENVPQHQQSTAAATTSVTDKKPALGGWRDAGRVGRDDPCCSGRGSNKETHTTSSLSKRGGGDIVIKEGFLNCYMSNSICTASCSPNGTTISASPDRGGGGVRGGGSTSISINRGDEQRQDRGGGKWVQVFMSLTGSCLSIFPSKALSDTRSAVPGSDASKPIVITITPSTLVAAFSDHFEPSVVVVDEPTPSPACPATTVTNSKKSVSPDPVAPEMTMPSSRGSSVTTNTKTTTTATQSGKVGKSSSSHRKSSWGKTLVGLHVEDPTSPILNQVVFLSASEEGLLTQWLKVIQQWCTPTHYNGRIPAVNNNFKLPKWLPFSSLLSTSPKGSTRDDHLCYCYADIIPSPVWDLVLPLHPHHTYVTKPTPTTASDQHRSPLASLTCRIANKKATSSKNKSLSREKSKEPSAPPIRKKLLALKQATLKMNERLSSRMASRTSSAANSLRCSTILQKSDAGDDCGTDDEMQSSRCSVVVVGGGDNNLVMMVEKQDVGVSCNLGEQAASTASSALQSKLATLTSQNVSLETTNAKLSGKVIELENRVDVAEFERDSWMDKYHELLAITKKSTTE